MLMAVLLAAGVGYLAYDPSAARPAINWCRKQLGIKGNESMKPIGSPNYMPVVPAQ
jgi:hypothetical protein